MKIHELKILPQYFISVVEDRKTFEVRLNDRCYKVDDVLILREIMSGTQEYTGRSTVKRITYIHENYGMEQGFVCLGLSTLFVAEVVYADTR